MSVKKRTVCLVTPSHPASNPRLVKEAGALHAAGYTVHVVAGRYFSPLDSLDQDIYRNAPWSHTCVDYSGGLHAAWHKFRRRLARSRIARGGSPDLADAMQAHHTAIPMLAKAAARVRADLYIGHCLAGLAAAGLAAQRTGARLGFDAEDFHSAETNASETDPVELATISVIEKHWLPRCVHITAASPLIGRAYAERYGIKLPITVLNVFPLSEAPVAPVSTAGGASPALLYWFSQTIGPGRGLEPLIAVLARMHTPCTLRLRGLPSEGFPEAFCLHAQTTGFRGTIEFVPLGAPHEMAKLAADADLGLSLEQSTPRNRDLCLTNKIFTYLLSGVPVALTSTSAQRSLGDELGAAALSLDLSRPDEAASVLDDYLDNPARQSEARTSAWALGRSRFNWDFEQARLVSSVDAVFTPSS